VWRPWRPTPRWEKAIVAALKRLSAFYLSDLGPKTPEEAAALHRAARNLAAAGKIAVLTWYGSDEPVAGMAVTIYRAGAREPLPGEVVRLKR
jgi:hypothetical protein